MTRKTFDKELERLQGAMIDLGHAVEKAILESVASLKQRDREKSRQLILQDRTLNEQRYGIEADALVLIATQQPLAGDLRTIAAILEIAHELERIGDYAKGIAKINLLMGEEPLLKPSDDIPHMAEKVSSMLHRALDAFVQRDVDLAHAIPPEDDVIDGCYNQINNALMTHVIANPDSIEQVNFLQWAAHNLERAADRVINICERVVFTITGEMKELDVNESLNTSAEGVH